MCLQLLLMVGGKGQTICKPLHISSNPCNVLWVPHLVRRRAAVRHNGPLAMATNRSLAAPAAPEATTLSGAQSA